jgi:hypothetical protein
MGGTIGTSLCAITSCSSNNGPYQHYINAYNGNTYLDSTILVFCAWSDNNQNAILSANSTYRFHFVTMNSYIGCPIYSLPISFVFSCNNSYVNEHQNEYIDIQISTQYVDIHIIQTIDSVCEIRAGYNASVW